MCGPSSQSTQLAGSAQSLAGIASANYNQRFQDQSTLLNGLSNILTPISQAGPSQQGFSQGQLDTLNTQAIDSTGAAAKNAAQATQGALAGRGGSSGLQSGVDAQIIAGQKSASAGQLAGQQLGIQNANYQQGNQNWQQANAGLQALSGDYGAAQFGNLAQSANSNAFTESDQIQQEKNQEQADIAGGITSLATSAATFGMGGIGNLDSQGTSTGGEQAGNFFSGGLSALKG